MIRSGYSPPIEYSATEYFSAEAVVWLLMQLHAYHIAASHQLTYDYIHFIRPFTCLFSLRV